MLDSNSGIIALMQPVNNGPVKLLDRRSAALDIARP